MFVIVIDYCKYRQPFFWFYRFVRKRRVSAFLCYQNWSIYHACRILFRVSSFVLSDMELIVSV